MRYLGIDFGEKRVGLALSDEGGSIAMPHSTIANNSELIANIAKLCGKENVGTIVIGESKDYSGKPNKIQHAIEEFVGLLTFEVMIPIEYCDERLSSAGAARVSPRRKDTHSLARGAKRPNAQHKAANLDASAAALILQSYLDSH